METIWIVLYRCRYEEGWKVEPKGVYADKRHAAMRLELETIDQPLWDHAVIEGQPRIFGAQSYRLGYHIKMAMYWSGYRALTGHEPKMKLLAIEKKPPYESVVYRVTKDVIVQGLEEWQNLERQIEVCEDANRWPAEYEDETDLLIPSWATENTESLDEFAMEEE